MVVSPDTPTLCYITRNGVKYFELVAEPVEREVDSAPVRATEPRS